MSQSKLINFLIFGSITPPELPKAAAEVIQVDPNLPAFAQIRAADHILHVREYNKRQARAALLVQQTKREHELIQRLRAQQQPIKHYFQQFVLPEIWLAPLTERPDYVARLARRAAIRWEMIEREYCMALLLRTEVTEVVNNWAQSHIMHVAIRLFRRKILEHSSPFDELDLGNLFS